MSRFGRWLTGLTAGGFALRVFWVLAVRPDCGPDGTGEPGCVAILGGVNDPLHFHLQANQMADGHWFLDPLLFRATGEALPSASKMPLFSTYLGIVSFFGGDTVLAHRIAACAAGAAAIVAIGLTVRLLAGPRAGLVAAGIAAVYPNLWINDILLQAESLFAALVAFTVFAAYRYWHQPTRRSAAVLGIVMGLTALARPEGVVLAVLIGVPLVLRARGDWRARAGDLVVLGAIGLALLGPWLVWNQTRFEDPVLLTSGSGGVLSTANCEATYDGALLGYAANCFDPVPVAAAVGIDVEDVPAHLRSLPEVERDAFARDQGTAFIQDNLDRLPAVVAARIGRMWDLYRPGQNIGLNADIEARGLQTSRAATAAYFLILPLAVGGAVVLWRRRIPLSPLLAAPLAVTFIAAVTYPSTRYRVSADVTLVVLAAVAVEVIARTRHPARERGLIGPEEQQRVER
jgi:4-amino-4-deoxy-L-arabinose transferase-like glycosyltransferase